jgi:hypothetical protein
MIVDPDFLDHWRTRMLVDALGGDEMAPFYLLRLWAHCQRRKAVRFDIPAAGLKGLCKAPCDAALLESSLIESGYIARDGAVIEVLKWAEQNASLIAAWENGAKGGRPHKKPSENPRVIEEEPTGNPAETQPEPMGNPAVTDKTREEKTREEDKPRKRVPRPSDVTQQTWDDWTALRKSKRAPVSETTVDGAREQAALAGMDLEAFLKVWCRRGSQGLEAVWLKTQERGAVAPVGKHTTSADETAQMLAKSREGTKPPSLETLARMAELRKAA